MRTVRYLIAIITAISLITAPAYSTGDFLFRGLLILFFSGKRM